MVTELVRGDKKNMEEMHTILHKGYHKNSSIHKQNCDLKYLQMSCTSVLIMSLTFRENVYINKKQMVKLKVCTFQFVHFFMQQDSVIGMVTRLLAGWPRKCGLLHGRGKRYSLIQMPRPTLRPHPASYSMSIRVSFLQGTEAMAWGWPLTSI